MSCVKRKSSITGLLLLLSLAALLCGASMVVAAGEDLQIRRIDPRLAAKDSIDNLACNAPLQGNACLGFNRAPGLTIIDNGDVSDQVIVTTQSVANLGYANCVIRDLNTAVNLTHSYVGDLIVELERGNLSRDIYFPPVSCNATGLDAIFDDEGPMAPNTCPASGLTLRPDESLSAFDGRRLDGTWRLTVRDVLSGDTGTFNRWGLAADVQCDLLTTGCTDDADTMCLNNERFRVEVDWQNSQGGSGIGQAFKLTDDSGYFWFFDQNNVEVVVKVLNACGSNNRYWVFAAGLTNVQVDLHVTDTQTGASVPYFNPQGVPFDPIQDTNAFATCP